MQAHNCIQSNLYCMRYTDWVWGALWCGSALALVATAPAEPSPSAIVGIWDAAHTVGNDLNGEITVTADRAELAGESATGTTEGTARVYRFAGGHGELRIISLGGERLGFWIQPPTVSGVAYATPVALRATASGTSVGHVEPLANRVAMTLYVQSGAGGATSAFIRDPLYNIGRRLGTMSVTANGDAFKFAAGESAITGRLGADGALTVSFPGGDIPPLTFARRTASEPAIDTSYIIPKADGDGWLVDAAGNVALHVQRLQELTRLAAGGVPASVTSPAVHSMLVARHGKLVFERYFAWFDEGTLHDTRSAGKTYADVLAGATMLAGVNIGAQTALLPLYARYAPLANPDPRKARITLGDALSMATGLDCDDNDEHSAANEDSMQSQSAQPDWYKLVLDSRMVRDPGTKAVYCSASINLAGGAIAAAAHAWLPALFARYVAEPLQMERYALNLTPTGDWYLGGRAYVRPRDFLKIGQVFIDGGTWRGRRIVPLAWIKRSWSTHLALGPGDDYGFAWHIRSYAVGGFTYRAYEAQGNGGQILDVLPGPDIAIMLTQGNYNNFATWGRMRDALVTGVLEAIEDK